MYYQKSAESAKFWEMVAREVGKGVGGTRVAGYVMVMCLESDIVVYGVLGVLVMLQ